MDLQSDDKIKLTDYIKSKQIDLVFNLIHGLGGEEERGGEEGGDLSRGS